MRKALTSILAGAAFLAPQIAATPAHAVGGWDRCHHGQLCLFEHDNGLGRGITPRSNVSNLGAFNFNDITSSVWNRSPNRVRLYFDVNYQNPTSIVLQPYGPPINLSWVEEDRISSIHAIQ